MCCGNDEALPTIAKMNKEDFIKLLANSILEHWIDWNDGAPHCQFCDGIDDKGVIVQCIEGKDTELTPHHQDCIVLKCRNYKNATPSNSSPRE